MLQTFVPLSYCDLSCSTTNCSNEQKKLLHVALHFCESYVGFNSTTGVKSYCQVDPRVKVPD